MLDNSGIVPKQLMSTMTPQTYAARRQTLLAQIRAQYPESTGVVLLFGALEQDGLSFKQERSFYYFSGVTEPGAVLLLDVASGASTLLIPHTNQQRELWVHQPLTVDAASAQRWGVEQVQYLGEPIKGFEFYPFFSVSEVSQLLSQLESYSPNGRIFTLNPASSRAYFESRFLLNRLLNFQPQLAKLVTDISGIVAGLRRLKDQAEISLMYQAINITVAAQQRAAEIIQPERYENEIQGLIEFTFTEAGATTAFPSIVGSGANSTVLHYMTNRGLMQAGDLVVVDIGASYDYYCADLTRTYPVSGKFTARQREIYELVLETQQYIAELAKPGMWLNYGEQASQSLNHLAHEFIKARGYGDYFPHGVGHYLGLDVHDVGSYATPLQAGDMITIEPGIYLPQEKLGVRIEDNYWITEKGAICLSDHLPSQVADVEGLMQPAG